MVKQLMRDRVRFEPKVSWLHILKREAGAFWCAGQAWTFGRGSHSSVTVRSIQDKGNISSMKGRPGH